MLNAIWLALVLGSVVYAAFRGEMRAVSTASLESAVDAVELVVRLVGPMMLFLGLMAVANAGGLLHAIARGLAPLLRRLFPDVPPDHPAMGAMVMNLASNVLGLGNAATPFGLKAMVELEKLNPHPGVASDSMALFLAINTSAITLMAPTGTIAVRVAAGSAQPEAVWVPTLIATTCSTTAAVLACFALRRLGRYRLPPAARPRRPAGVEPEGPGDDLPEAALPPEPGPPTPTGRWLCLVLLAALAAAAVLDAAQRIPAEGLGAWTRGFSRDWLLPLLFAGLLGVGMRVGVRAYEVFVTGAREGLEVGLRILPFLLAILVGVGMFRASGAFDLLVSVIDPLTSRIGIPAEALPMALLRPLSGSGAFGLMAEILEREGPDSFVGLLVSTLQGSTETTFYVLAVYFGASRTRDGRYTLAACLCGDVAGLLGATAACHLFFG